MTIEDGLPSNYVRDLMQDSRGFMWFGTLDGLARYDGHEFVIYQHDPRDTTTLSNNWIFSLCEDHTGAIWIGTHNGLNRLDPVTGKIKRYYFNPPGSTRPDVLMVFDIFQARDSTLWVSVLGDKGGLYRYDRRRDTFVGYHHDPDDSTTLSANQVKDIVEDRFGYLWIASAIGGLNRFDPKTGRVMRFLRPPEDAFNCNYGMVDSGGAIWFSYWKGLARVAPRTLKLERILPKGYEEAAERLKLISLFQDSRGVYWIIGDRVGHFSPEQGTFRAVPLSPDGLDSRYEPWRAIEDRSHNLWIATLAGGVFRLDLKPQYITHYRHNPYSANSLNSDNIQILHESRNGDIWIVTASRGICRFDPVSETFERFAHDPQDPNSLGDNTIYALLEDHNGTMWFGTYAGGLNRFNPETRDFTRYSADPGDPNSLASQHIWSLAEDNEGNIWVGTAYNALNRFDPHREHLTTFYLHKLLGLKNKKIAWRVWQIFRDRDGIFWVRAYKDDLYRFNPATYEVLRIQRPPESPYPFASVRLQSRDGRLWGGVVGLFDLTPGDHRFKVHFLEPENGIPLDYKNLTDIYEDEHGMLWCASGVGLYKFNPEERKAVAHYTRADGLPSNVVEKILPGRAGELWVGTRSGISIFREEAPPGQRFRNLGPEQGLVNAMTSNRTFIKAANGDIYWGGSNGLYRFRAGIAHANPYVPPVRLTGFRLFNQPAKFDTSISEIKTIHLSHDQNFFTFRFAALEFTSPKRNRYAYRLEGFDDTWRDAGNRNQAEYTNVPPGTYTFRVKAANNDGVWNEEGASVRIIITPPWWRTGWAYASYVVMLLLALYAMRRFELNRMHLHHELRRREFEARKLQEMDEMKSRFFANISHEFRTPLTLILGPLDILLARSRSRQAREALRMMRRNALRLQRLINQLLDLSKLQSGRMTLRAQQINLVTFVRSLVMAFASLAESRHIRLTFSAASDPVFLFADRDKLEKIMSNLITNAIKFTPEEGQVHVSIRRPGSDRAEIAVADTGPGIAAEHVKKIFDRFYQVEGSGTHKQDGSGIGLALAKELVELHHGSIQVESEPGNGSTFVVELPMGKTHLKPHEIAEGEPADSEIEFETAEDGIQEITGAPSVKSGPGEAPLVLIVEDNADVRSYMRWRLRNDYRIIEAVDGVEGFDRAVAVMPDIIISDVMMPRLDGFAFCRKLKKDPRSSHIPVILLTARASGESKIEGLQTGADDYITKPFNLNELQARVKNLIEQRQRLRERFQREFILQPKDSHCLSADERFLRRAVEIIEAHMADPDFSVQRFTRLIGLSAMQLHRKLRALTGQSAGRFIRMVRLKRAALLLEKGFGNVAEIAYEVGFNNPSYFAACFREVYGVSPREYARKRRIAAK